MRSMPARGMLCRVRAALDCAWLLSSKAIGVKSTHLCWPDVCPGQQFCAPAQQTGTCQQICSGTLQHCTSWAPMATLQGRSRRQSGSWLTVSTTCRAQTCSVTSGLPPVKYTSLICMQRPAARCSAQSAPLLQVNGCEKANHAVTNIIHKQSPAARCEPLSMLRPGVQSSCNPPLPQGTTSSPAPRSPPRCEHSAGGSPPSRPPWGRPQSRHPCWCAACTEMSWISTAGLRGLISHVSTHKQA